MGHRRPGYLGPLWYINRPNRHVRRVKYLKVVCIFFVAPACLDRFPASLACGRASGLGTLSNPCHANHTYLVIIRLPRIRVEVFRTCPDPIVERYCGVHLRNMPPWQTIWMISLQILKSGSPQGTALQRVLRCRPRFQNCEPRPNGSRMGREFSDLDFCYI